MLSDQLHECRSAFNGRKGEMETKIYLETAEQQSILVIQLRNQVKLEFFQLKVDQAYLAQNPEMAFCFETPEDLFYTLMELFQEVCVSEEGLLTFEMKLNATKLKKKVFKLEIVKQDIDPNEMMGLKCETLKRQFRSELAAKDQRIEQLGKKTSELEVLVEGLKQEVGQMKKEGEELSLEYKKKDFKMNSIIKESDLQRQEIAILRKSLEEFHKKFSLLEFYNYFDNPHWHYFSVYRGDQSVIIIKKDSDSIWHTFIRNVPLAEGKTYQFKIKQLKTNYRNVMIGVITREAFGQAYAYKLRSSIAYNSYSGNVWEKGNSRKGGSSVMDGQTVAIEVNLIDYKVIWFIEGKKAAESSVPAEFKNREVFLCLQLYNIEDELELMLY